MNNVSFLKYISNSGDPVMRDYQHANRLYVDSSYARSPKVGFLYFVQLNINPSLYKGSNLDRQDVGLLAKKVDLPKFNIETETLNQYNRKTIVQKALKYNPVSIELHDDNSDITHNLWTNYYKNYYYDGQQGSAAFKDTKYNFADYTYGRYDNGSLTDFFDSIDLYVLHQSKFTQYTLVNPKIKDWQHDSVGQEGTKILQNKMTVEYESVLYKQGEIVEGSKPLNWAVRYYDKTPSPNTINGKTGTKLQTPAQNLDKRAGDFDKKGKERNYGTLRPQSSDILTQLGTIVLKNYINENGLTRQKSVAYNIAGSVMNATLSSGSGKYASPPSTESAPGVFNLPGGVGINIFKGFNTSVDGKIRANPAAIIFPPKV